MAKEHTESRLDTRFTWKPHAGKKTTGDGEANHYEMKQYKRWEPTRMGRLQIPHGFHFLLDGFGGSKPLLSSL